MHVLFTSMRVVSHFLPLVPFIEACRGRGHEVTIAAPSELEERATATGAAFVPLTHPGDKALEPIWARMRDASPEESKRMAIEDLFAGALASAALPGLIETIGRVRPSVVVRESQEYSALVASEKMGIPHAHVAITARNAEVQIFELATSALDAMRRSVGLTADPRGERLMSEPAVTLFPASLEDPKLPASAVTRYRAHNEPAPPLPDWWQGSQAPLVYLTLGTVTANMKEMRSMFGVVLDAVRELPVRVLLTTGGDLLPEILEKVPPNVHLERFVPQHEILPHARVVLCHGGSGSVIGALTAGAPMVVTPMFADQMNNAERVAALGAGIAMPKRTDAAGDIAQALSRVLEEPSFRAMAQKVAAEIAALPPVDDAALELERIANA
jgi:UDP:flavonoid glycosyltransferase YjiC (YdhE family)